MPAKPLISLLFFIGSALLFTQTLAKEEAPLEPGMVNPGYEEKPDWFKNSFLDINEDIAEAKDSGKRLMLYFYQDGCPYCKKLLQDNFGQRSIAEKTRKNFDVVPINIWGDREVTLGDKVLTEKKFAAQLRVMYTPTLIFFNEDGKAILRANGYYQPDKFNAALDYVIGKHDANENFRSYLARVEPAPSKGVLHRQVETMQSPYRFDKPPANGYRLVMFEQKQCRECDELHLDILEREPSKKLLEPFEVAVLDMWSEEKIIRPDGKPVKMRDWARQLNVQYAPTMIYFNREGEEVFRSEGYLKAFHVQSIMDYVASSSYKQQPNFQRYIDGRAHDLREAGVEVDLMN